MNRTILPLSALSFILVACDSGPPASQIDENLSMEEVAERAREATIKPEPGQYRVSMEVLEVDIQGAPAEIADMMRTNMGGQTHEYCMTQDDVDKGFEEMARQGQDENCSFERFDIDGGDIDAKMSCDLPGQGAMTMTMVGTATPTSSEIEMTMQGSMTGLGDSTIKMKAKHERTGDCG